MLCDDLIMLFVSQRNDINQFTLFAVEIAWKCLGDHTKGWFSNFAMLAQTMEYQTYTNIMFNTHIYTVINVSRHVMRKHALIYLSVSTVYCVYCTLYAVCLWRHSKQLWIYCQSKWVNAQSPIRTHRTHTYLPNRFHLLSVRTARLIEERMNME